MGREQWDASPRYRQIDVEKGIAGNQKLPYQNEASTFRTSRHQRYPGAEAIDGPNAGATPDDFDISQDDDRIQENDMPSATKQMAVAANHGRTSITFYQQLVSVIGISELWILRTASRAMRLIRLALLLVSTLHKNGQAR
jgi:hypothetical protein